MDECADVPTVVRRQLLGADEEEQGGGGGGGGGEQREAAGLTDAQRDVLEKCLHALKHAKNDSHTLAALLLITRLCPANQLDKPTLSRIFEAVGLNLPARLLATALRGSAGSVQPVEELLSLGTALLSALSTDPDLAAHPQLLATVPLLLELLAHGPEGKPAETGPEPGCESAPDTAEEAPPLSRLDEALAADCYQVLTAVCALPGGPDQLLSRGAVPALCRAVDQNQTFSRTRGLVLLGRLLSGKTKDRAWTRHPHELLALLVRLSQDFCRSTDRTKLDTCSQLVQFLPPAGAEADRDQLGGVVSCMWGELRPMMQAKLTPRQVGRALVLAACLLDLYGWEPAGPPRFCCLLVNRACVEVRMGLEEPPGTDLSPELQDTLTGCYRIMEAAMEQACCPGPPQTPVPPQPPTPGLSLQQSRQVLGVLEEAFSALMYHLQQVDPSRYGDPFVFTTFRALCSWLAEETSCLREEVTRLLPFLIGYSRSHMAGGGPERGLADWMSNMSVTVETGGWTGREALRYLLPALCHLSAEDGPRKVLLGLDTPALLVDFLSQSWACLKGRSGSAGGGRDAGMETACSALLNFTVTEAERVGKDPCFRTLESLLSEALPVLVHKPRLLVLAANFCTLGLMMNRLKSAPTGPAEAGQRRFFSAALRLLRGAVDPGSGPAGREESWEEAAELWRLSLQALGGCVAALPWVAALLREEGWLGHALVLLSRAGPLPDQNTRDALEEALCAAARQCPLCRRQISDSMTTDHTAALSSMKNLKKLLEVK